MYVGHFCFSVLQLLKHTGGTLNEPSVHAWHEYEHVRAKMAAGQSISAVTDVVHASGTGVGTGDAVVDDGVGALTLAWHDA